MGLTDFAIRQAKATDRPYTLGDSDGLSLVISAQGRKSWHFRYYWQATQKRMSLGTYPEVTLREARYLRDQARALLSKGINPRLDRKRKQQAVHLAQENSFEAIYQQWLTHRRLELQDGRQSTLAQMQRIFGKDVLPKVGRFPIHEIRRFDLLDILRKIETRGALTTAEKVRTWLNQLYRYALVVVDGLEHNPAADLDVVARPKPPVAHNPFLSLRELPEFLRTLRTYHGRTVTTQLGLRLLLLTGVRTGELRRAEPSQFRLDQGLWVIPPANVKQWQIELRRGSRRVQDIPAYIVPLSAQAIEIVQYLLERVKPAQRYLLPQRSDLKKRISENTLNGALKKMGYQNRLTGHGIRATLSTALNEIGYPRVWVEAQLSHVDPSKVSAAYNHAAYVEPRRQMMQDWADRLDLLEQGYVEQATVPLQIRAGSAVAEGSPRSVHRPMTEFAAGSVASTAPTLIAMAPENAPAGVSTHFHRLSAVPEARKTPETTVDTPIQRNRKERLEAYEAPHNLSIPAFAKLAGKSRDQINREIASGQLLAVSFGNRGRHVPDWQLDPVRRQLIQSVRQRAPEFEAWDVYWAMLQPCVCLNERLAADGLAEEDRQSVEEEVLRSLSSKQWLK
ncbi:tyrosine-type recombinase/integrase [Bordetella bronchiseptica]|uniref:tyrosine-type recombinase/integrase n=1 Tax=Bordetella bronchiseptica TaxID=518 RepID=UPI00404A64D4